MKGSYSANGYRLVSLLRVKALWETRPLVVKKGGPRLRVPTTLDIHLERRKENRMGELEWNYRHYSLREYNRTKKILFILQLEVSILVLERMKTDLLIGDFGLGTREMRPPANQI